MAGRSCIEWGPSFLSRIKGVKQQAEERLRMFAPCSFVKSPPARAPSCALIARPPLHPSRTMSGIELTLSFPSAGRRSRGRARARRAVCTPGSRGARASWRASCSADAPSRPSSKARTEDLQHRFVERTQALEARNEELTRLRFALETANRRLKHLVGVDALTGIANRRHFDRALEREMRRARRDAQPLSLVFLDLDEFKLFNDSYGHTRGDEVLRKVAQTLDETFRRGGDLVARYGGEEFAVVLPGVDGRRAGLYAERLRRRIWRLAIPYNASQLTRPGHDQRRRRDRLSARRRHARRPAVRGGQSPVSREMPGPQSHRHCRSAVRAAASRR